MQLYLLISYLLSAVFTVQSSKILFVATIPAISHFRLSFRLAKELGDKGHEVTIINPYPRKVPIKNYKDVSIEETVPILDAVRSTLFQMDEQGAVMNLKLIYDAGLTLTELIYKNQNVQKLLRSDETFDVLVIEHFSSESLLGIAHHYNIPCVIISGFGMTSIVNHFYANPAPSSYVPNIMMGSYVKNMNFWTRLQNFLLNIVIDSMREYYLLSEHRKILQKYIDSEVELDDLIHNVSIILSNSHVSVYDPAPQMPNMIHIAGYHLDPPEKLPTDLQNFLDNSKNGFILFAMGSNLKSKDLKPETRDAILRAFSKLKQNVLWKFETQIDNLPKNVKIMEWVPQQDVLAHPNIRVFITHGGMLSTVEAVTFGVPLIGIPVFGDQMTNIEAAAAKGFGIGIPLSQLTEERLSGALDEVLNNPKYRETMKQKSSLMNDRLVRPIDEAVYWVEYVIRHKGAPHFRTAAVDMAWYQREMIDIIGFLVVVLIAAFYFWLLIVRQVFRCLVHRKAGTTENKKKN